MNGGNENDGPVIRWGIIGAGNVAEFKSGPALMQAPGSTVVAVMRRDAEKARDFALRHGVPRWYTDVDALLADPEVDAVYVASPHHLHLAHVTRAAQAGKAILCEKPVGVSTAEAQAAVDVCRAASVPLSVAYYRRYWPVVQEMRRLLAEGAIGEVVQARVQLADYFQPDPERAWLTEPEQAGGGALGQRREPLDRPDPVSAGGSRRGDRGVFGAFRRVQNGRYHRRSDAHGQPGARVAQRDAVFPRSRQRVRYCRHGRAFVCRPPIRRPPDVAAGFPRA